MHEFNLWLTLLTIVVVFGALQGTAGFLVYVERKICAYMQDRIGPNRVGPYGLLQVLADGLKFILKEEFIPKNADKTLFILAPVHRADDGHARLCRRAVRSDSGRSAPAASVVCHRHASTSARARRARLLDMMRKPPFTRHRINS